jgi:hypothetical protein
VSKKWGPPHRSSCITSRNGISDWRTSCWIGHVFSRLDRRRRQAWPSNSRTPLSEPLQSALLHEGKPKTFHNIRTPIKKRRHCDGDVRDYGGHRGALNPKGLNLTDVWGDIPPVRHWKFKSNKRRANAQSTKLLERVVEMSTGPGDVVLDLFGGSGTTFAVCEKSRRRWIGIEVESTDAIIERLENNDLSHYKNEDFVER